MAFRAVPYFSTLFHERHDFQKKTIEYKRSFDFLSLLSKTFITTERIQRDTIVNLCRYSCKAIANLFRF